MEVGDWLEASYCYISAPNHHHKSEDSCKNLIFSEIEHGSSSEEIISLFISRWSNIFARDIYILLLS